MNNIIDKYYDTNKSWDNIKIQPDEYCEEMKLDNTRDTYDIDKIIKIGGVCLLVGVGMSLFSYIGKETIPTTNNFYGSLNPINNIGLCTLGCGMAIMVVVFG